MCTTKAEKWASIVEKQEEYCDCMQYFDMYELKDYPILKQKIAFALFGAPDGNSLMENDESLELAGDDFINAHYNKSGQKEKINLVYNTIITEGTFDRIPNVLYMSIILVIGETDEGNLFQTSVFRIRKCHSAVSVHAHAEEILDILDGNTEDVPLKQHYCQLFIDDEARVYQDWNSYLEENQLPSCEMYVPTNGVYERKWLMEDKWVVQISNHQSPNKSVLSKATKVADVAGTVGSIGSAAVLIAAAVPAITVAPIAIAGATAVAVGTGIYTGARSIYSLFDRSKHKQTLSLKNSDARGHWMSVGAGIATGASSGVRIGAQKLIERGVTIGTVGRGIINFSTGTNIVLNGCSVADSTYRVISKINDGEQPTSLDVLQLTTSILFFGHSVVTAKSATTLINETQGKVLNDIKASLSSNNKRRAFNKLFKETERIHGIVEGRSQMIRGLRYVKNQDDFFGSLWRNNKMFNKNNVRYSLTPTGEVMLNNKSTITATSLQTSPQDALVTSLTTAQGRAPTHPEAPPPKLRGSIVNSTSSSFHVDPALIQTGINVATKIYMNREDISKAVDDMIENFEPYVRDGLREILHFMWDHVKDLEDHIQRTFPNTIPVIEVLKFLLRYIRDRDNSHDSVSESIFFSSEVFNTFMEDWSVNGVKDIIHQFCDWLRIKSQMSLEMSMYGAKEVPCMNCSGVYYVRE